MFKNVYALCTEETYNALVECKKAAKENKIKGRKQRSKCIKELSRKCSKSAIQHILMMFQFETFQGCNLY